MDVDGGVLSPYSFLVLPRQNTAGGGGGGGGGPGSSNGTSPSSTATTGLGNGNNGGPQQTAPPQPSGTDQGGPPQQQNQSAGGTPLSVFTFVIAVALFALVISFVLFRTWRSRRRGGQFNPYDANGMSRFFGIPGKIEDNSVPPKLWEARFVPYKDQEASASYGSISSGHQQVAGWGNLMPVSASLPVSLYMDVGTDASAVNDKEKSTSRRNGGRSSISNNNTKAQASSGGIESEGGETTVDNPEERIAGSVNISVLVAMPSPPKSKDALPELMLGTAAVPIFTRQQQQQTDESTPMNKGLTNAYAGSSAFQGGSAPGYFPPPTPQAPLPPTRAQLLALILAARQAKEMQQERAAKADTEQDPVTQPGENSLDSTISPPTGDRTLS